MTTIAERPASLGPAAGIELVGPIPGTGYRGGAALVRRADGQLVRLGPLLYALLECLEGDCDRTTVAAEMSRRLGRSVSEDNVDQLAHKLAEQGLLAGHEHKAPPRPNPLLALRWKVLVTNTTITRRLTAPFAWLFHPVLMWPALVAFGAVCWFVLFDKGLASATAQAFSSPGLLLLVFVVAMLSAGWHEFGHAAACKYGGATPSGMGAGLYIVFPAFYTDVTDAYRLNRRGRLRVDFGGLYFNALVAVATTAVWFVVRRDALLLLVAMQLLQMARQLSPVIRADGYHILADATGVPDLYAHLGPTLRRLVPGRHREPSALTGRTRALVSVWVLVIVPVLASLAVGAVVLLPRLATNAWESGHHIAASIPHDAASGHVLGVLASLLRLLALALPVLGSALVAARLTQTMGRRALVWSRHRPLRRAAVAVAAALVCAGLAWAWWPSGQYRPVRANDRGTIGSLVHLIGAPRSVGTQHAVVPRARPVLALVMVPRGGVSARHPEFALLPGAAGAPPRAVLSDGHASVTFPFQIPARPTGPGDTQAVAVNTRDGGVVYDVEYALVTVNDGAPVTATDSAYAFASCRGCTTVAVSFQVVLVVGQSDRITPVNEAGALNYQCPACTTTALADQLVITLSRQPTPQLQAQLQAALAKLGAIRQLGSGATPAQVEAAVTAVQQEVDSALASSGLETSATAEPSAASSPSESTTGSGAPATAPGASASATDGSATPQPTPTDSATSTDSPSPSPSASPSGSQSSG